jgi:hypothetical protein
MKTNQIAITLSDDEAWALAQYTKRVGWDELRAKAQGDDEAHLISDAIHVLQKALSEAGYSPR